MFEVHQKFSLLLKHFVKGEDDDRATKGSALRLRFQSYLSEPVAERKRLTPSRSDERLTERTDDQSEESVVVFVVGGGGVIRQLGRAVGRRRRVEWRAEAAAAATSAVAARARTARKRNAT